MEPAACTREAPNGLNPNLIRYVFTLPAADILEMKKYTFEAKMKLTADAGSGDPYFVNWILYIPQGTNPSSLQLDGSSQFVSK